MGKATRSKQDKAASEENQVRERLLAHNKNQINVAKHAALNERPLYLDILKYSDHFVRDAASYVIKTKSKDKTKQLMELVRHTFGKYPVCFALSSVWEVPQPQNFDGYNHHNWRHPPLRQAHVPNRPIANVLTVDGIDFQKWYISVATGGSLYKEHAKNYLTKKEVHILVNCPHQINAKQAMIYAVAKGAGASDGIALRVAKTKLQEKQFTEFWRSVVRFFATHETESINQINDLIDYINYEHTRFIARQGQQVLNEFTMAGKNIAGLKKKMTDWHYNLRRVKAIGDAQWEGFAIGDQIIESRNHEGDVVRWKFQQIKTAKELAAEGNRMRHCVFSYKDRAINGLLSIWSMQKETYFETFEPKITIELRNDGTIVQARGVGNRATKNDEETVLRKWAAQNHLYLQRY